MPVPGPTRPAARRVAPAAALALGAVLAWAATAATAPARGAASLPNDPLFAQQWNLEQIHAPQAWTVSTGQGVRIGIVDTGVDLHHEDLAGKVVASANCVNSNGDPSTCSTAPGAAQDDNGHGTHVAGIAAAVTNNHLGVAGTAPNAQLVVAKSLDSNGSGTFADVNAGIMWTVQHGARVVNLSLGDATPLVTGLLGGGDSLATGIDYAWSHGAVPVLAAGNTNLLGLGTSNYGNTSAIVVGASGRDGQVAPYSSPTGNAMWAVLAPGGNGESGGQPDCSTPADQVDCVLSTYWFAGQENHYAYDEGTSMAAPHVAGTVALLLAMGRTPQQAVNAILASADHQVSCGPNSSTCRGLLDAAAAVGAAAPSSSKGTAPAGTGTGTGAGTRTGTGAGTGSPATSQPSPSSTPTRAVPTTGASEASGASSSPTFLSPLGNSPAASSSSPAGPGAPAAQTTTGGSPLGLATVPSTGNDPSGSPFTTSSPAPPGGSLPPLAAPVPDGAKGSPPVLATAVGAALLVVAGLSTAALGRRRRSRPPTS